MAWRRYYPQPPPPVHFIPLWAPRAVRVVAVHPFFLGTASGTPKCWSCAACCRSRAYQMGQEGLGGRGGVEAGVRLLLSADVGGPKASGATEVIASPGGTEPVEPLCNSTTAIG
jgi:hypothetical protein